MESIQFDSGIQEYSLNGMGVLRFHPGDPNLYARFFDALDRIKEIVADLAGDAAVEPMTGRQTVQLMERTDREVKDLLSWTFGGDNDFHKLLGDVNLMAVAGNGKQVITNLLDALEPILVEGASKCTQQQVDLAMQQAEKERDAR